MADNKELTTSQETPPVEENTGAIVLKLKKPLNWEGRVYEEITLDLENLTGKDSMEVENELMMRKKGAVIYGALNNDYILGIAAKACKEKLGTDAFLALGLKDHNKLKETVRNFLLK